MGYRKAEIDTDWDQISIPPELRSLIPAFLQRREQDVQFLRMLLNTSDYKQIKYLAHKLKGQGASYGLGKISEVGAELEVAASESNKELVQKLIDEFNDTVASLRSQFIN